MASRLSTTVLSPPMAPTTPANFEVRPLKWRTHPMSWLSAHPKALLSRVAPSMVEDLVKSVSPLFHLERPSPPSPTQTPRAFNSRLSTPSKVGVLRWISQVTLPATPPLQSTQANTTSPSQIPSQLVTQLWPGHGSTRLVTAKCT